MKKKPGVRELRRLMFDEGYDAAATSLKAEAKSGLGPDAFAAFAMGATLSALVSGYATVAVQVSQQAADDWLATLLDKVSGDIRAACRIRLRFQFVRRDGKRKDGGA